MRDIPSGMRMLMLQAPQPPPPPIRYSCLGPTEGFRALCIPTHLSILMVVGTVHLRDLRDPAELLGRTLYSQEVLSTPRHTHYFVFVACRMWTLPCVPMGNGTLPYSLLGVERGGFGKSWKRRSRTWPIEDERGRGVGLQNFERRLYCLQGIADSTCC
jgi:hypothetical protein